MKPAIDTGRLSHLIGLIYDSAIDAKLWPIAMEAIRVELDCANSTLNLQKLPGGEVMINLATNIPQHYVDRIPDYGADVLDQWGGAEAVMALPIAEPQILSRVNPLVVDLARTTNRYTLEWARPQGLFDVIAVGLARDADALGSLAFGRHLDAGPFGPREEEILRLLIPHLQRAATINRIIDQSLIAKATFEAAIDILSLPVLLTDDLMHILHANPAARRMLEDGGLIRETGGRLAAEDKHVTAALKRAVERIVVEIDTDGAKGLGIPVRQEDGSSGVLYVLPLRKGAALVPRAAVAIFVAQTGMPFAAPTEIMTALFDLTPAEARVFERIVIGETMAQTAAALGVGSSTIKTHMLRIYEKSGVRRRAELQQMASSLSVPVAV